MNNKTIIEFGFQLLGQMIRKRNSKIVKYGTVQPPCATTSRKRLSPISDHLFKTKKNNFPSQIKEYVWKLS